MDFNTFIALAFNKNCKITEAASAPLRKVLMQRVLWLKLQHKFATTQNPEEEAFNSVLSETELFPQYKQHRYDETLTSLSRSVEEFPEILYSAESEEDRIGEDLIADDPYLSRESLIVDEHDTILIPVAYDDYAVTVPRELKRQGDREIIKRTCASWPRRIHRAQPGPVRYRPHKREHPLQREERNAVPEYLVEVNPVPLEVEKELPSYNDLVFSSCYPGVSKSQEFGCQRSQTAIAH
eukprot:gene1441-4601_t